MDTEWQRRLVVGDQTALGEIYDALSGVVHGLALRVTRDRSGAEDVTQETFISLWQRPQAFDSSKGSLRSWLCMLAHRRAVDWVRASESQRRRAASAAKETGALVVEPVDTMVIQLSQEHEVGRALERLTPEQSEVIRLAYFEGLTFCQVAKAVGIPEGTAKSRIRLGLQRLATELKPMTVEVSGS